VTLLRVEDLSVRFRTGGHVVHAVRGVSFEIAAGECLAIVGESGSGKSVTARSLVGLAGAGSTVDGRLEFDGQQMNGVPERRWRRIRGREIGVVPQDAMVALDPLRTVGDEVAEPLLAHKLAGSRDVRAKVLKLLTDVGLSEPGRRATLYPHELSGGQRQRALIASAIAAGPKLVIADEPTTALDVTVQAQVLDLLATMKAAGTALLLVSHDLAVVAGIADRIAVMRDGLIVEHGTAQQVLTAPEHPYTCELLAAVKPAEPRENAAPVEPVPVLDVRAVSKRWSHDTVGDVSFQLYRGETVGLVGESGAGKTTVARILLGLLPPDSGEVLLDGAPWSSLPESARRPLRQGIAAVFQDSLSSFDPRYTVARVVAEALRGDQRDRVIDLLGQVGLSQDMLTRRPRDLSGGQRQRVAIARALASGPRVLVCDEPVSSLDVSIQAKVLGLLAGLQRDLGLSMVLISHDVGVIRRMCDRVVVMAAGEVVEAGRTDEVFARPVHPYTRTLLASVPRVPS
jgi:peptide/nickel transport system ATP-binding protein